MRLQDSSKWHYHWYCAIARIAAFLNVAYVGMCYRAKKSDFAQYFNLFTHNAWFFSSFFLFTILPNGSNHLGMILVVFLLKLFRLRNLYAQDNFNSFTFLLDYRAKVKIALDESTSWLSICSQQPLTLTCI